ncbi:ABC transporter permease [Saccharibacillus alkalitolerans]|uniref:ABC transporter permease subunit n=1 Tax=Saccharibacillus alkalitolerans TaxID=2705290 RepID=A0ABX0F6M7_9BACL|nr:ABC transporter permease subunit [Saccharibacillus alkalitolerans]NGZ74831.1 ABC transporter permease subunit [Saccharibacillus alkalitolerans]
MSNFFGLVHNENVKIYARVRTWIMLGIIALTALLMPVLMYFVSDEIGLWSVMNTLLLFKFLPTVFAIAVAADSVAGEFARGTIKLLLIRPWSRSKVLLAKYLSLVLFMLGLFTLFTGLGLLASAILFGTGSASDDLLAQISGSMSAYFWWSLLYGIVESLIYMTMAFMFSAVFRSNSLAVALTIILLFMGNVITLLVDPAKYAIGRYLLFANLDLTQYINSATGQHGVMSLGFSLAVLAVYYAVFLGLAFWVFRKRDVAA